MIRAAQIENGVVVGVLIVPALDCFEGIELVAASAGTGVGWAYDGENFIAPPPAPPTIPESVTALQGLLAIDAAGMSAAYEAWASSPDRTFAEKAFINKAMTWRRDDEVLIAGATALGLTSSQIDDLFVLANSL